MAIYEVEMQHTEKTFEALSHMQYDLFCTNNRIVRTILSFTLIVGGVLNFSEWWGILITAYGCYLTTSTYSSANHTAHKLSAQIKASGMPFPASRYAFLAQNMEIISPPEEEGKTTFLAYTDVYRLAEDSLYFYIFRDQYGGYMIPKEALDGREKEFRSFLQQRTGMTFYQRAAPIIRLLKQFQAK